MGSYVTDTFDYADGPIIVRKKTWYDDTSGQTWDTFDTVGPNEKSAPDGTVFGQGDSGGYNVGNAVSSAANLVSQVPLQGPYADPNPNANDPVGLNGPTRVGEDRTHGTNTPISGTSTTGAAMPTGGNPGSPQATPSGTSFAPGGGGAVDQNLIDQQRNMFLYNPSNPSGAMANVLRGMGFHPGQGSNPFDNMLMRYAPGLGAAFGIQNVNANPGANVSAPADMGGEFASFIKQNLQGGGMYNTMQAARGGIGDALSAIANSFGQSSQTDVNPYIEALKMALDANGTGMGLPGMMGALQSAFLTPQMSQAYTQGLTGAANQGAYNYANSGQFGQPTSDSNYWIQQLFNGGR